MAIISVSFDQFREIFKMEMKTFWYIRRRNFYEIYSPFIGNHIVKTTKRRMNQQDDMLFLNDFLKDSTEIKSIQQEESNDIDKNALLQIFNTLKEILEEVKK